MRGGRLVFGFLRGRTGAIHLTLKTLNSLYMHPWADCSSAGWHGGGRYRKISFSLEWSSDRSRRRGCRWCWYRYCTVVNRQTQDDKMWTYFCFFEAGASSSAAAAVAASVVSAMVLVFVHAVDYVGMNQWNGRTNPLLLGLCESVPVSMILTEAVRRASKDFGDATTTCRPIIHCACQSMSHQMKHQIVTYNPTYILTKVICKPGNFLLRLQLQ